MDRQKDQRKRYHASLGSEASALLEGRVDFPRTCHDVSRILPVAARSAVAPVAHSGSPGAASTVAYAPSPLSPQPEPVLLAVQEDEGLSEELTEDEDELDPDPKGDKLFAVDPMDMPLDGLLLLQLLIF